MISRKIEQVLSITLMLFVRAISFSFLLFLFSLAAGAQAEKEFYVVKDFKQGWETYNGKEMVPFSGQATRAIHFQADLSVAAGKFILIKSNKQVYLFLNSVLSTHSKELIVLSCDSLKELGLTTVQFGIFQDEKISNLTTTLVSTHPPANLNPERQRTAYRDFLILATLVVLNFFTILLRTNPQLMSDYLNVAKLVYSVGLDENPNLLRITSSANLLFYAYGSLMAALALIIAAHYSDTGTLLQYFNFNTVSHSLLNWLILSALILGLLFLKLFVDMVAAHIFSWPEITGFQFFNFVRILLTILILLALIALLSFSFAIKINYASLLYIGCLMLLAGTIIIYFKLLKRSPFHSIHLFFYLCITEIFPLMILFKVLLF